MHLGVRARLALVLVIFVGLVFAFGFPMRTYLDQRHQILIAEHHLAVLQDQNVKLHREAQRLASDAEVERLGRSLYNLVKPGEEAYAIVPMPAQPPAGPSPRSGVAAPHHRERAPVAKHTRVAGAWYHRVWHSIVGIL